MQLVKEIEEALPPSSKVGKLDTMTKVAYMIVKSIKRNSNIFYDYYYYGFFYLHLHNSYRSLFLWCTLISWYILVISTPDIRNPGPPSITNTNQYSIKMFKDSYHLHI